MLEGCCFAHWCSILSSPDLPSLINHSLLAYNLFPTLKRSSPGVFFNTKCQDNR